MFRLNTQNFEGFFCASWTKFHDLHDQITNLDTLSSNLIDTVRWHWKYELITKLAVWRTEDSLLRYHPGMKAKNCLWQPVSFKGSLNKSSPVGSRWYKTYIRSNLWSIVSIEIRMLPLTGAKDPLKDKTWSNFTVIFPYLGKQSRDKARNVHWNNTLIWL